MWKMYYGMKILFNDGTNESSYRSLVSLLSWKKQHPLSEYFNYV